MDNRLRKKLKEIRESRFISVAQAAHWAGVADRTWRSYESQFSSSNRNPSRRSLWNFFYKSNFVMPDEFRAYIFSGETRQTLAITSYKGGIGKSPVTIDIAACLVARNFKVAIITSDSVYRGMAANKFNPEDGSLVSKIDFYDEKDVLFKRSEIQELKRQVYSARVSASREFPQNIGVLMLPDLIERLRRKEGAKNKFEEMKNEYHYILLDMNREIEKIRDLANVVMLLTDISCFQSINSSEVFIKDFKELFRKRKRNPLLFGLITKKETGGQRSVLEEYYGEKIAIEENDYKELQVQRESHRNQREKNLSTINGLNIPILKNSFSFAHEEIVNDYNREHYMLRGYSYFSSVLDVAPASYAALEVNQLVDELIELRM